MATLPNAPQPVQPFAAVLHGVDSSSLEEAISGLEGLWSPIALRGPSHPFDRTDYYVPEMGEHLQRTLIAFQNLEQPGWLVSAKHAAAALEDRFRIDGKRRINIDVGYLDLFKVVLASWKERGHKLYLSDGVWADITLTYGKGVFRPLEWTFPDFRTGLYDQELLAMRDIYKERLRGAEEEA